MPEIISRAEAEAKGLLHYFTGKPCSRGHIAKRFVTSFGCIICAAGHAHNYYWQHRKECRRKGRERHRLWRLTEAGKQWRFDHLAQPKLFECQECGREKFARAGVRFCSRDCNRHFHNKRRVYPPAGKIVDCIVCGKEFFALKAAKICSDHCRRKRRKTYAKSRTNWKETYRRNPGSHIFRTREYRLCHELFGQSPGKLSSELRNAVREVIAFQRAIYNLRREVKC